MLCCEHCCCLTLSCCGLALWQVMSGLVASAWIGCISTCAGLNACPWAPQRPVYRSKPVQAAMRRGICERPPALCLEALAGLMRGAVYARASIYMNPIRNSYIKRRVSTIYRCGHPPVLNIIVRTPRSKCAHVLPRLSICKKALRINQRSIEPLTQHPSIQEPIIDKYMHCHDTAHTANTRVWRQVPTAQ